MSPQTNLGGCSHVNSGCLLPRRRWLRPRGALGPAEGAGGRAVRAGSPDAGPTLAPHLLDAVLAPASGCVTAALSALGLHFAVLFLAGLSSTFLSHSTRVLQP